EQPLPGELAQADDDLRPDGADLPLEERLAAQDLVGLGVAVLRRPAFDHVSDPHLGPPHLQALLDDVGEELARPAHEGQALLVFVRPRGLPHEHEGRLGIALAEDDVLPAPRQLAPLAVADELADGREVLRGRGGGPLGLGPRPIVRDPDAGERGVEPGPLGEVTEDRLALAHRRAALPTRAPLRSAITRSQIASASARFEPSGTSTSPPSRSRRTAPLASVPKPTP